MDMLGIPKEQLFVYDTRLECYPITSKRYSRNWLSYANKSADLVLVPSGSDLHQDHQVVHNEDLRAFKQVSIWL